MNPRYRWVGRFLKIIGVLVISGVVIHSIATLVTG
jgi:hypothetical protein